MSDLLIISQPTKNKIIVVRAIAPDEGVLLVGDIAFNAMLIAHANSYEEACTIIKNIGE